MFPRHHKLPNGQALHIREAVDSDAQPVLDHVHAISGETDFLSFGPGEFEITLNQETQILAHYREASNQLYLLALIDEAIVASLSFSAGRRPRVCHAGEFSLSVRRPHWGLGIGALMLDALLDWARATSVVTKIDLRVRTDNPRAIDLYRRKGFVIEGTIHRAICIDGTYYDHYWMGKVL